jgi:hypothetical protein
MAVSRINEAGLNVNQYGNRNLIINGAMQVAQRGTSFTNPSVSAYTLDRWSTTYSHDGAVDISQSTTTPAGFKNSLKIDVTTADSSLSSSQYHILQQVIEGQNLSHLNYGSSDAKEVTISFWVRSNKTGTYCVEIQTSGSQELARPYTINTANTWEHKTLTWIANTDFTITETNAIGLYIYWWLAAGSDYTGSPIATTWASNTNRVTGQTNFLDSTSNELYITGVQLEVGDTATDFEHRTFADELDKCKRYFEKITKETNSTFIGGGMWYNSTSPYVGCKYKVTKRAVPTVTSATDSNGYTFFVGGSSRAASALDFSRQTTYSVRVSQSGGLSGSGGTNPQATHATWLEITGSGASIEIDAEL